MVDGCVGSVRLFFPIHQYGFNFNFSFEVHDGFQLSKFYEFD